VLVVSGRPMLVSDKLGSIGALVASWLPGSEGAGVADVLFGDKPFTGRLPATWARKMADLPINVGDATYDPEFPFGWGLRTDSAKARLQRARDLGVTSLDAVLAADDWNADGSVKHGADVLVRLGTVAHELDQTTAESWEVDDLVVSVARDLAQAAMVRKGIDAATSALSADAEHALYTGDVGAALARLSRIAVTSSSDDGGVGGEVPATLAISLGAPASFGSFTPGVAWDYGASTTANVISSAGDATLSVADPSTTAPGRLVNGTYPLPSPLQAKVDGPYAAVSGTPLALHSWAGPVSNDLLTVWFQQHIGANDGLRTGRYGKTLTFSLSTTLP
jgi:beta-glucosidase